MPELPEVEVLVRYLRPLVIGKVIRQIAVCRERVISPTPRRQLLQRLRGARILGLERRGKYLVFELRRAGEKETFILLGHLGMTGRMFVVKQGDPLPKHTAVWFDFGRERFVYEDPRYFGRMTLDSSALAQLGPEPLSDEFTPTCFATALRRSSQAIKVKLLDQTVVAGVGNIYASEALFRAGISPRLAARRLSEAQVRRLRQTVRAVLREAIRCGSTIPLSFAQPAADGLFYFGRTAGTPDYYEERLLVYDRAGKPCLRCRTPIKRIVQAARSTFFCPRCQTLANRLR